LLEAAAKYQGIWDEDGLVRATDIWGGCRVVSVTLAQLQVHRKNCDRGWNIN
jgi:hypothetical protein